MEVGLQLMGVDAGLCWPVILLGVIVVILWSTISDLSSIGAGLEVMRTCDGVKD